jgi:hypothetical protein
MSKINLITGNDNEVKDFGETPSFFEHKFTNDDNLRIPNKRGKTNDLKD